MCGRYADAREADIVDLFHVEVVLDHKEPTRNVSPTQAVWMIGPGASDGAGGRVPRVLRLARWGLVPSWSKALPARPLINARAETVTEKPSFRVAAAKRRAILPAAGYYEWAATPTGKAPYFLHSDDAPVLGFAGLYEWWRVPDGLTLPGVVDGWLLSTTIITRPAMDAIGQIHDRMPVVVPPDLVDDWLDPGLTAQGDVESLLASIPDPALAVTARSPTDKGD